MKKIKILAVNDERFFIALLEFNILAQGLPIILDKATNGEEAVAKIKEGNEYDAILMNLEMPAMNGWQATKEIRALGITTPIIAWSAHDKESTIEGCLEVGMNDYIEINVMDTLQVVLETLRTLGSVS